MNYNYSIAFCSASICKYKHWIKLLHSIWMQHRLQKVQECDARADAIRAYSQVNNITTYIRQLF
ncbi:hypothetical protein BH10BAC2_BH10BAC2_20110 [soil metagenome]